MPGLMDLAKETRQEVLVQYLGEGVTNWHLKDAVQEKEGDEAAVVRLIGFRNIEHARDNGVSGMNESATDVETHAGGLHLRPSGI